MAHSIPTTVPWSVPAEARDVPVRALRIALILGAAVDLSGAIPLFFDPAGMAERLGVHINHFSLTFWPMYAAVFLFVLPIFYLLGSIDPLRNMVVIIGAIFGRLMGAAFYLACFFLLEKHWIWLSLSVMNALFAFYYAGALGPAGPALIRNALRPTR